LEDGLGVFKDPIREESVLQELFDLFLGIEFWAIGSKGETSDGYPSVISSLILLSNNPMNVNENGVRSNLLAHLQNGSSSHRWLSIHH
jgi:hypothetical protein